MEEPIVRPLPHSFPTLYDMDEFTERMNRLGSDGWEPYGVQWPGFFLRREHENG